MSTGCEIGGSGLHAILVNGALVVLVSHFAQYGFLLSGESIKPDIKKINPVEGAKKIFSIKSLMEFVKSLLKVTLLSLLVWITIEGNLQALLIDLVKAKPATSKGQYLQKISVSSTMGPGVTVDQSSLSLK